MKWINLLWVIIVNIFLMLIVSITMEYLDLTTRLQQLENTISTSVETAVDTSMASEEFFTEKFADKVYSQSGSLNKDVKTRAASKIRWYNPDNHSWVTGMTYIMAGYYEEKGGKFPETQRVYNSYEASKSDGKIYNWLFQSIDNLSDAQEPGNSYIAGDLPNWSSTNERTASAVRALGLRYDEASRQANESLYEYFNKVGKNITMNTAVKVREGSTQRFHVEPIEVPTLLNTGLLLYDGTRGNQNYNKISSNVINDNFIQATHVGKRRGSTSDAYSKYYLTPYSLGVTYVPIKVFEPVLKSHLQQTALFNRLVFEGYAENGGTVEDSTNDDESNDVQTVLDGGIGCLETSVYPNSDDIAVKHADTGNYINDGDIEYDLDSIKIDVDYKTVDFYDKNNADVITRVIGSKASEGSESQRETLEETVEGLKNSDTINDSTKGSKPGLRVLARVTVRIKVNIPYHSAILQWLDYLKGEEMRDVTHYGIKMWNPETGYMKENSDGIWYQYTTYRAISR